MAKITYTVRENGKKPIEVKNLSGINPEAIYIHSADLVGLDPSDLGDEIDKLIDKTLIGGQVTILID